VVTVDSDNGNNRKKVYIVYFACRTAGAFIGAFILSRFSSIDGPCYRSVGKSVRSGCCHIPVWIIPACMFVSVEEIIYPAAKTRVDNVPIK
jgi:hypothetical protein